MRVSVDIEAGRVLLDETELRNQWVDFYALLALSRLNPSCAELFVGADAVGRAGTWRYKVPASVGKEIARHLAWLDERSLGALVSHRGKTQAWRLNLPPSAIQVQPSVEAARAWLEGRSVKSAAEQGWTSDIRRLVEATITLQEGEAEKTLHDLAPPLSEGADPTAQAWAALLRGRAAYQQDDDDLLTELHDEWFKRADGAGRTVSARLRALIAARSRFEVPEEALRTLSRLAAELELRGDTAALGAILNVMGLLVRRMGDPKTAMMHHLRAVALLGIVGDYPSLEGSLFNLANCRREALQKEGLPIDEATFTLVELARVVSQRFTIGRSSAQTEIAAAQWAYEMKDPVRARHYLREAEAIVKHAESAYDQACFHFARARLERDFPDGSADPLRDLRIAERIFEELGDVTALAETRRMLRRFTSEPRGKRGQ